ncbi:RNA polymerase sigma factor [Bryobacter aggregatus]|uniref:RNA polymerase sigma factor n=1 Tax=Bryobacter aggregatus TaxID=360054 RepID=UPI0004E0F508|nr:sigma-70 family RNA polymerase sigma factor [Bryobacter aggregatus]
MKIVTYPEIELLHSSAPPGQLEQHLVALFQQFHGPLFRYLRSLGLGEHDSEEVIQEVFLALFRHLRAEKPQDNLRGWLFRVAHNLALKTRQRESLPELLDTADPNLNPEQLAVRNQRHRRLAAVVRALDERDRACLSLRAEGFRYREISEILDVSLGAVAQSIQRSLERLNRADES